MIVDATCAPSNIRYTYDVSLQHYPSRLLADKIYECERVEVERKFSLGKRKCGMGLVTAKLEETAAHVVALSILLLNLRKIQHAFLRFLDWLFGFLMPCKKMMVNQ